VKEQPGKATNVSRLDAPSRRRLHLPNSLHRLLQDAAKQGQHTADKTAKQAQQPLGDLAAVASDVMTSAPEPPKSATDQISSKAEQTKNDTTQAGRSTDDKAEEAEKDAKNAAGGTAEQAAKSFKTPEGKQEGQDGDSFSGLEMTTHFPKSTSANDVWVNVTTTADRTSVTIRIPGR
jgi:hypothetical protein